MGKQARTVLSLAFGLGVRYDALQKNPVRDIARMRKQSAQAMALTVGQVEAIRAAVRGWRRGTGFAGAPADGHLEPERRLRLATHDAAASRSELAVTCGTGRSAAVANPAVVKAAVRSSTLG